MRRTMAAVIAAVSFGLTLAGSANAGEAVWTGAVSNDWGTAANWDVNQVPGAGDTVTIPAETPVCIYSAGNGATSIAGLSLAGELSITGGTLTLTGASTVTGMLNLTGGAVVPTAGLDIASGATLAWTGGTIGTIGATSSVTIAANAALDISGAFDKNFQGTSALVNNGAITWGGTGDLRLLLGATDSVTITNNGLFDITDDAWFYRAAGWSGTAVINNSSSGTIRKSAGSGESYFGAFVAVNNDGTLEVQTGTVTFAGGGAGAGAFTVAAGTHLKFLSPDYTLNDGATLSGAGTFDVTSGTVKVAGDTRGTVTLAAESTLALSGSGDLGGNGQFTINGTLDWTGGFVGVSGEAPVLTVSSGAILDISGTADKHFHGSPTITNNGTVTFGGTGTVYLLMGTADSVTITNNALFDITADATFGAVAPTWSGTVVINNSGTIQKSAGLGNTNFPASVAVNNDGTLEVQTGTVTLAGSGAGAGAFTVAAGTHLKFSSPDYTLNDGATLSGAGTFDVTSGTVKVAGDTRGTVTLGAESTLALSGSGDLGGNGQFMINGTLNWTGGFVGVSGEAPVLTVSSGANLDISGTADKHFHGSPTITNNGTVTFGGTGTVYLLMGNADSVTITNNALFDITADATFGAVAPTWSGTVVINNSNSGIIRKSAGPGNTDFAASVAVSNTGTVRAESGTLRFGHTLSQTAGSTVLAGGALTVNDGFDLQGGTLEGIGTITGNVTNAGTVSPGASPGTLTIDGNYTQSVAGTLSVELGGLAAGTEFDVLVVTGTATLDGTLTGVFVNAFVPEKDDAFQIVSGGTVTGTFATVNLPALTGAKWKTEYNTDNVTLRVVADADLAIAMTAAPDPVIPGAVLTYTLDVTNAGPADADNTVLTGSVDAHVGTLEYSTDSRATWTPWTGTVALGDLAVSGAAHILVRGRVDPTATAALVSSATVASDMDDPDETNNATGDVTTNLVSNAALLTTDTVVGSGDTTFDGYDLTVGDGATPVTVTFDGPHNFKSITVKNGATVTQIQDGSINLTVDNDVTIEAGGAIDTTGKGYLGGRQPGNADDYGQTRSGSTGSSNQCGGSHGGLGGQGTAGTVGETYDDFRNPSFPGAGGGGTTDVAGGNGGGLVRLVAGGTIVVDGSIIANGGPAQGVEAGGGAGGGIRLQAAALTGSGAISANGGAGFGATRRGQAPENGSGGGGGGRVAILAPIGVFTGTLTPAATVPGGAGDAAGNVGSLYLDSDNDGMPDSWEIAQFGDLTHDGTADTDDDGLTDLEEFDLGTDPTVADTDGDGMPDGWEVANNLDPLIDDAGADPDSDGLTNAQEYANDTDPHNADTDGDGVPDGWEVANSLDPLTDDAGADPDSDSLTNAQEYANDTDPHNADTDGDGMPDGWEVDSGLDPLVDDAADDPDGDGMPNSMELLNDLDPHVANYIEDVRTVAPADTQTDVPLDALLTVTIDHVPTALCEIGNGGESRRLDGPAYTFLMGQTQVTVKQYIDFLNDLYVYWYWYGRYSRSNEQAPTQFYVDYETGRAYFNGAMTTDSLLFDPAECNANGYFDYGIEFYDAGSRNGDGPYTYDPAFAAYPIVGVTWYGAIKYCNWLSWRKGLDPSRWCYGDGENASDFRPANLTAEQWADGFDAAERQAWIDAYPDGYRLPMDQYEAEAAPFNEFYQATAWDPNAGEYRYAGTAPYINTWDDKDSTHGPEPAEPLQWNAYGLAHALGNVWVWMTDSYALGDLSQRTIRGWSWWNDPAEMDEKNGAAFRWGVPPNQGCSDVGFRVVTQRDYKFEIQLSTDQTFSTRSAVTTRELSVYRWWLPGLEPGQTYYWRVRAVYPDGALPSSQWCGSNGYTDPAQPATFTTAGDAMETVTIPVISGWNLISTPLTPSSIIPMGGLLETRSGLTFWGWDREAGTYQAYDTMTPGRGYWFYSSVAGELGVLGTAPDVTDVTASPGWNLLGPIVAIPNLDMTGLGPVYGWDPDQQAYTTEVIGLTLLNGYWVFVAPGAGTVGLQPVAARR